MIRLSTQVALRVGDSVCVLAHEPARAALQPSYKAQNKKLAFKFSGPRIFYPERSPIAALPHGVTM